MNIAIKLIAAVTVALFTMSMKRVLGKVFVQNISGKLPKHPEKVYQSRSLLDIDQIVLHHSATLNGTALAFANFHIQERDWPGIGYHFVIAKNGEIEQVNELTTVSYHTQGQNLQAIGICLVGDYDKQTIPDAQLSCCVLLCRHLFQKLGRELIINGHNQYASKSCPGHNTKIDLIRNLI